MMTTLATSHVGLSVTDLGRSVEFYSSVLGFEATLGKTTPAASLEHDGELVVTLWEQSGSGYDRAQAGLHHLAFQVGSREEVEAVEERAKQAGATFIYDGPVAYRSDSPAGAVFFEDPDGIRIEVGTESGFEDAPVPLPGKPTCGLF